MRTFALLPVLLLAVACSGKVSIGTNDNQSNLKKNPDGTPTGDGSSCTYGGVTSKVGDRFPSPDGCNTCSCTAQGAACTEMGCVDAGPPIGCAYNARQVSVGETFPSADGCNTCSCQEDGSVVCTKRACATDGGAPLDCSAKGACSGPAPGMPTILCSDGSTGGPVCDLDPTAFQPVCTWQFRSCACDGAPGHKSGDSWQEACSSCACDSAGRVACTATACACPPDGSIDCMPPVPANLASTCSGPYHQWVVANCPNVKFAF